MNVEELQPLLSRYQGSGPRYTSYPTAPHFKDNFTGQDYRRIALESNEIPVPRPLSLYVHIPFCGALCYYCACNKVVTQNTETVEQYMDYLYRELAMQGKLYSGDRLLQQVHLGGGTPTYLSTEMIEELIEMVAQSFHLAPPSKLEMSIEIDPRTIDGKAAAELSEIGFNRFSIGVQDLDPKVQKAINREQKIEKITEIVGALRGAGSNSIGFDLIYGLPRQNADSFAKSLELTLLLRPDRLSLFHYAHMPQRVAAQRLINEGDLPDSSEKLRIFSTAKILLENAGYTQVGIDHFVLSEDPLCKALASQKLQRNFQGYSTHADSDLIGVGVSAISKVNGCYAQNMQNMKDYRTCLDGGSFPVVRGFELDDDDKIRAQLIQDLMCRGAVYWEDLDNYFGVDSFSYFQNERLALRQFEQDGLVFVSQSGFRVSENGRYFMRNLAMLFDRYLASTSSTTVVSLPLHSTPNYSKVL